MNLTELAEQLDGRIAVTLRPHLFRATDAEARWVCRLYGYRIASERRAGPNTELLAVVDQDPAARARGAWMRRPNLTPGVHSPVPWTCAAGAGTPWAWTPPGRPQGHTPLRPAPDRMPGPSADRIRAQNDPALLLLLAALFTVLAVLIADARPDGALLLGLFAVGSLAAYPPAKRHRELLQRRADAAAEASALGNHLD
ncbi:hypothetical protein OH807_38290 [Kitasatospora sp. NBC_01560]|uniref:hypothetical protein n=1 Tax=Kitasatospora sp. NBC_01560 TaxID=2975965 RepID=UPI00386F2491